MRRHVMPLFVANAVAFASVGLSYFMYSRLLTASEFGAYSAALAVGNLAVLILDGGIRTSIIKHTAELKREEESALLTLMLGFSVLLLLVLFLGRNAVAHFYPAAEKQIGFVAAFAAVYLATYPWIGLSTAALERRLDYSWIAWIESIGIVLERGAPVLLMIAGMRLGAFVAGVIAGRLFRLLALSLQHSVAFTASIRGSSVVVRSLLREGLWYQIGGAASLIRDNLHIIIVGPIYGANWVGYYTWALQLCTLASQIFVQISARVSLAVTSRSTEFAERWTTIAKQLAMLTTITAPILAMVIVVAPPADHLFFADKWHAALSLLPFLCARMIPGIACTPIGILLLVERGSRALAVALWIWTGFEWLAAYLMVKLLGSAGLAVSYAFAAWFGVLVLTRGLGHGSQSLFMRICAIIMGRPALWISAVLLAVIVGIRSRSGISQQAWISGVGGLLIALAFLVDPQVRSVLRRD